jgi:hypothetical protein
MSLINDALRRARQAQEQPPIPPIITSGPPFRPVEQDPGPPRRILLVVPAALLVVVGLSALLLAWLWPGSAAPELQAKARSSQAGTSAPGIANSAPTPVAEPSPPPSALDATVTNESAGPSQVAPPEPVLKLQAIIYHPTRPSAIISGRSLFVGDRFDHLRLTAVTRDSVTLTGNGETHRLNLVP